MEEKELTQNLDKKIKREDIELKLYKKLGIEQFRKLVFLLEKIIHHKDKGKNVNYHVKENELNSIKDFKKYLYYNGSIHVRNVILLSLFIIIKVLFFKVSLIYDMFLLLNLAIDTYCVMLQRYNFIRINKFSRKMEALNNKKRERDALKVEEKLKEKNIDLSLTKEQKAKNLELITKMQNYLSNTSDIRIDDESIENLKRIRDFFVVYNQYKNNGVGEEKGKEKVL